MIADDDQKARWKKGIITKTHKSKDGQVRSAVVKTATGEYTRPVIKLAVMDVRAPEIPAEEKNPGTENTKENTATKRSSNQPADEACTSKQRQFMRRTSENILKGYEFGKAKTIDVDKVKEIAAEIAKPKVKKAKSRVRPVTWMNWMVILYLACSMFGTALSFEGSGLIAYDCGNPEVNLTSYSLLDVASCIPPLNNLTANEVQIQVLQRNAKSDIRAFQCKVIIKRTIKHCGMHSHTSDYERSYEYIVKEFTFEECRYSQQLGIVKLTYDIQLRELKRNATTRGETLIVGSVWGSNCKGGTYRTPIYTWADALVYYEYEITLHDYVATVDYENDVIHLRNGLTCVYSHGRCLDTEDGYITWDMASNNKCEETEYEVIYEGIVNKTMNENKNKQIEKANVVYSTVSNTHLFSIRAKEQTKICGHVGFTTDHPRILIVEVIGFNSPFRRKAATGKNFDLFTYFNSKITLVENYIGQTMTELYNTVMTVTVFLVRLS